jgi:hypothetical protein
MIKLALKSTKVEKFVSPGPAVLSGCRLQDALKGAT